MLLEMENNEVADILLKYKEGSTKLYDILINHLSDPGLKNEVLLHCLKSLKGCTTLLSKEFEHLVGVILKIDWLLFDVSIIKEYQGFIINLVSAHPDYLRSCLRMIVKQFIPKCETPKSQSETAVIDVQTRQMHEQGFLQLHWLLKNISRLIPMTPTLLIPQLTESFPFMTKDSYTQACYVRNLLQVAQYMPKLRVRILELTVDKMLKLDVRSPRQAIQELDSESDDDMDVIFDMEGIEKNERTSPEPKPSNINEGLPMTHKEADRLDVMMDVVLGFIQQVCHKDQGELDWEATKLLYRELLLIFDRILLPTHASCHVQFIMFYICQFKQPLVEGFIEYLWKKASDPNTQTIFRQASVAYIASILCRAKYIPISLVGSCLDTMVGWARLYIRQTADSGSKADIAHHGSFYSVCQAIFYVFAFRIKELVSMPNGFKFCQGLNLQTIVTCRLNPLKFCLPIVTRTFSSITRNHQLVYCDSIMERNRRMTLPEAGSGYAEQTRLTHLNPLDSFFPFDPYCLSRSGKFIHPLYQEYEGTQEEECDTILEEDYDSDGMSKDSQEDLVFGSFSAKAQVMATSPTNLLMYSISPGFKHL